MRMIVRVFACLAFLAGCFLPTGVATAAPPETEVLDFETGQFNTCNGELLVLRGTVTIVTVETGEGDIVERISARLKGVGDQGNEYVMNETFHRYSRDFEVSLLTYNGVLVSKGSTANQSVTLHHTGTGPVIVETHCYGSSL